MTHIVTEACIRCKFMDCVSACPVDCFHEGDNMLVINPEGCIDCGLCIPECKAKAIIPDTNLEADKWGEINKKYSALWPTIVHKKNPPDDANDWIEVSDKFQKYFSSKLP